MTQSVAGEIVETDQDTVCCDGGDGALGHPAVYLHVKPGKDTQCPYCSRLYRLRMAA